MDSAQLKSRLRRRSLFAKRIQIATPPQSDFTSKPHLQRVKDGMKWELYVSGNFDGQSVTDFLLMEGYASDDESVGEWTYYSTETSEPAITATWNFEDDGFNFNLMIQADEEKIVFTLKRENEENWIEVSGGSSDVLVYWNEDTGFGFFEEGGDRSCFSRDNGYENIECPA